MSIIGWLFGKKKEPKKAVGTKATVEAQVKSADQSISKPRPTIEEYVNDCNRLLIYIDKACKSKITRENAKKDIIATGDSVIDSLILCFEQSKSLMPAYAYDVKNFIIETLGEIGTSRATEVLISLLSDKEGISGGDRSSAAEALSKIEKNELIIEALVQALRDESKHVRIEAKKALKKFGWIPSNDVDRALLLLLDNDLFMNIENQFLKFGQPAVEAIKIARNFDWGDSNQIVRKNIIRMIEFLRSKGFTIEETPEDIIAKARPYLCQSNSPEYDRNIADQLIKTPKQTIRAIKNRRWSKRGNEDEALNDFLMRLLGRIYSEFDDKNIRSDSMEAIVRAFGEADDNTTGWKSLIDLATKILIENKISGARNFLNQLRYMADKSVITAIDNVLSKEW